MSSRKERRQERREIRIISSEPVLADILSKHEPILVSKEGWNWIVEWIATIGSIMRSRDYIAFNIAMIISNLTLEKVFSLLSESEVAKILRRFNV